MKLKSFWGFLSLTAVLLTFTACSDDDDDNDTSLPTSAYVVGSYTGNLEMAFAYGTQNYENKTITITANASNNNYIDVAFTDDELGTLSGAKGIMLITNSDASHSFSYEDVDCVLAMPTHDGGMADYACVVAGTISEDQKDFEITLTMPGVMGGTTYTLTPAN